MSENLTGSVLVAHPALRDPNFRRTVLFLSQHGGDGATGFVLNRELQESVSIGVFPVEIPLYYGGPVQTDRVVLASLQWRENPTMVAFRSFAAVQTPAEIEESWLPGLRAFAGFSGWSAGQLEGEIREGAWIVIPPTQEIIEARGPETIWRDILRSSGPMLHLLSEAPDHPERN